MELSEFATRLDDRLDTAAYSDVDASANGLQVGPADATVEHAAFAVDAAVATIEDAADAGSDVLVTHHGLSWGGIERVTDRQYDRIAALVENDLALYVSHLPLDGHATLGNAAGLADHLGLVDTAAFGSLGPVTVGRQGRLPAGRSLEALVSTLAEALEDDASLRTLAFGPEEVEDVAIVTGSGVDWLGEAVAAGADVLLTGEGKQQVYHEAREAGINVVLAGHYATETAGVQRLRNLAADWGLETSYHSHPTGL
jgi:dinuclear metal center YbgI/SA1388 family protein